VGDDAGRSLAALGLTRDPIGHPLAYPGRSPAEPGLLDGDRFLALRTGPEGWRLSGGRPMDDVLHDRGRPVLADRRPVLAVGSNGSPAQVHRKLTGRAPVLVPMTHVATVGLVSGVSAHVSRPGYVPAAPVLVPGATGRFVVLWLDEEQLPVVDATEPNYRRVPLPDAVAPGDGRTVAGCELYAGRHGCLVDRRGRPFHLTGQAELLGSLLADLPELGRVTGADGPEEFVARVRGDEDLRTAVRALWRREGRVLLQPGLGLEDTGETPS
jgi:hypothetical protein